MPHFVGPGWCSSRGALKLGPVGNQEKELAVEHQKVLPLNTSHGATPIFPSRRWLSALRRPLWARGKDVWREQWRRAVCLGGRSLSLQEGGKGMYKASSSSPSAGSKSKLTQSSKGSCGSSSGVSGKHPSAKRRTSSEDSSLEPDMAELSLDDGSSLALGAEASNTFDFLPPPPEMLPSPSPLLREPLKTVVLLQKERVPFETKRVLPCC